MGWHLVFRKARKSTLYMITHYFKLAWRNMLAQKLFAGINILSLALGIAACLAIFLFIRDEESFDGFHAGKENIYRLNEIQSFPGTNTQHVALSMPGMGPNLNKDYPEIEAYARYHNHGRQLVTNGDAEQMVQPAVGVDSTFLEMFNFPLLFGDPATALDQPNGVVIRRSTARALFQKEDVLGRSIELMGEPYQVTGVFDDLPENSHLQFDLLFSLTSYTSEDPGYNQRFGSNYLVTYLQMRPGTDIAALEAKMPEFLLRYMPPEEGQTGDVNDLYKVYFQSLPEVHLASTHVEHDYQNYRKFNGQYLTVFRWVGLFILLIAAVNFMNLMTARASHRWKEVGVRKTIGARRRQLFQQFLSESLLLGLIAFGFALVLDSVLLPLLNPLIDRELSLQYFLAEPGFLFVAFGLTLSMSLLAGIYPSLYLSSYRAVDILKGGDVKTQRSIFRSSLVVLQFGLAIALIVASLIVLNQLSYMQNKDIGFNKDHILLVNMNRTANRVFPQLKEELNREANVLGVTAAGQRLGNNFHQWGFKVRTDSVRAITPSNVHVDYDYLDVYGIELLEGRGFSKERPKDNGRSFVINESLARELGLEDPVGTLAGHEFYDNDSLGTIIGVTRDFHFNSLHYAINTLAMVVHEDWGFEELSVKISGDDIPAGIASVERIWNKMVPDWPFQYSFLDEHFETLYRSDKQMQSVVAIMACLAILIACMGLFGLAAITTERKIKEIGIRKILGASPGQILVQISGSFARLVLIAFLCFSPLTWWLMRRWLEQFAYRIDISIWVFLLGGGTALLIAMLTISYHALRSARANPVESLRYE